MNTCPNLIVESQMHGKRLFIYGSLLLSLLLCSGNLATAGETGTVIVLKGKAWISRRSETWVMLKQGDPVNFGDSVRTEGNSHAGILNPDGTLDRIPEESKILYKPGRRITTNSGILVMLDELFSSGERTRVVGSRGDEENRCPGEKDWANLIQLDSILDTDLKGIFRTARKFEQCGNLANAAALISRLRDSFPEVAGYRHLAENIIARAKSKLGYNLQAQWNVFLRVGKGKQTMGTSENEITEGSRLRIHYHAGKPSYLYLFLTDMQSPTTRRIFPTSQNTIFPEYIAAGSRGTIIPRRGWASFPKNRADKYLWGWSCMAPLNGKILAEKVRHFENWIRDHRTPYPISDHLPDQCLNVLYQKYTMR
ncbi:MAG: hypothetical protein HOC71_12360 [Candidatus Latescibacteria bacterium]|jgi:hypothetical protein|nr:hypothetical protein [Candidatus Latescibacterota bacterium]